MSTPTREADIALERDLPRRETPACVQSSRIAAPCQKCGGRPLVVHINTKPLATYCPQCCPVCAASQENPE